MPALVETQSKRVSSKPEKLASMSSAKRKSAAKEAETKSEVHKAKKSKGKEKSKEQDKEEHLSKGAGKAKETGAKKEVALKEKESGTHKKSRGTNSTFKKAPENKIMTKGKATKRKERTPPPEPSEAEGDDDEAEDGEDAAEEGDEQSEAADSSKEDDDEAPLHGFSSESDSSDEGDDDVDKAPIDVGKLPTVAKVDASVKRKLEKAKKLPAEDRGVIYVGRIPHGFYEEQMKAYFSQFGDVTRLRLSRNKKTGRSKHYAFIEFKSSAVAQIVAETMDNYLLMGHLLQCKHIPKEEIHPELWIGANRKFRKVPTSRVEKVHQNKIRTDEERKNVERRLLKRQKQKKRRLEELGIDYDFGAVSYSKKAKKNT